MNRDDILCAMRDSRYPLSSAYNPDWIIANHMGSHCLWLLESLLQEMDIQPGMRVLDLGCGKALSSIFLAKERGAQVWAADLWVNPTENWQRVTQAGVGQLVYPIRAEAHDLPFADNFYNAAVSINALQFFATSEYYLNDHFTRLIRPGGQIGMVVPGVYEDFDEVPPYIKDHWKPEFYSWHSPSWWKRHWERTGLVDVEMADAFPDGEGARLFRTWARIAREGGDPLLEADESRNITFLRIVVKRK